MIIQRSSFYRESGDVRGTSALDAKTSGGCFWGAVIRAMRGCDLTNEVTFEFSTATSAAHSENGAPRSCENAERIYLYN